jgi:hypothetical protein
MRLAIIALCLALLGTRAAANIIPVVNVIISYPHETSTVVVNQCIAFIRMRGGVVSRIYGTFSSLLRYAMHQLARLISDLCD